MTTLTTFEFKAKEGQGDDLLIFFKRIFSFLLSFLIQAPEITVYEMLEDV